MHDHSLPVQADIRYLITLHAGQSAAVLNMGIHLENALRNDGVHVHQLNIKNIPQTPHLDAVFLYLPAGDLAQILRTCTQTLNPAGQILLCLPHRSIKAIVGGNLWNRYSFQEIRKIVHKIGLRVLAEYGLYDNVYEPRFFIPLQNQHAVNHFFSAMLTPYTRMQKFTLAVAPFLVAAHQQSLLFSDVCFVLSSPC